MSEWGRFPFGKPNLQRPARKATTSDAVVVGVYPSAFHVRWVAPPGIDCGKGGISALAVDVEPVVFWDGSSPDPRELLARWKLDVGFIDREHGSVTPSGNGPSGAKVVHSYLAPLGLVPERVTFTDVYPVYMVHSKPRKKSIRSQGLAIQEDYDPRAQSMGFAPSTIGSRIDDRELPARAAARFGASLIHDLAEARTSLIITLGKEVWNTLLALPQLRAQPPATDFDALLQNYGGVGKLQIAGHSVDWLPLVHPGLLGSGSHWETVHAAWAVSPKHVL